MQKRKEKMECKHTKCKVKKKRGQNIKGRAFSLDRKLSNVTKRRVIVVILQNN